ncbi:MAG TPA: hypothetical protein VFF73_38380 [Planctomycetota bacterium]|nr:hypothetical protein [Planctomycetota bacterium]
MSALPATVTLTNSTTQLGDVALVQWEAGLATGMLPEGANGRRPTMNYFNVSSSESSVFLMEPESDEGRKWLKQLRDMPSSRLKKIMRIREEIQKGTYETKDKWRVALDRLIRDLKS